MSTQSLQQRIERGIVLAAAQKPCRISEDVWSVNGWLTDGDSCACPDHENTGVTCKHMAYVVVWEARESRRAA